MVWGSGESAVWDICGSEMGSLYYAEGQKIPTFLTELQVE